jgi:4-amino-4-deoxy-L-arabinose transferase-like glycosyltransferase
VALAVAYSLASPLYEPTDELRHFRYVRHIAVYHALPVQSSEGPRAQSHHPPLYYALGALVSGWVPVAQEVYYQPATNPYWGYRSWEVSTDNKSQYLHGLDERFPYQGVALALYLVRWLTVLAGAGAVFLTASIGRELWPGRPELALGGAALIAFNPQFLYLSGAVSNDVPAALASAAVLLMCARLLRREPGWRTDVGLGVTLGLALLTKLNLAALFGVVELAYVVAVWRRRDWRAFLRGTMIILALALLLAGWWFWRNQVLYGDPTGMSKVNELWAGTHPGERGWLLWQSLPYLWSSLVGRFGYGQVPLPSPLYQVGLAGCTVSLLGFALPRRRHHPTSGVVLLGVTCLAISGVVAYYILIQPAGAMGRFLFPALPAFALLVVAGASRWSPRRWRVDPSLIVGAGALSVALYALCGVLGPAFARPRALTAREIAAVPNPAGAEFGTVARLLGYEVTPDALAPGEVVWVTLYWQALQRTDLPLAVFVHFLSETGTMIAQRDTYPGMGRFPTTAWEPGAAFVDRVRVDVSESAYAPDVGAIQVGVYDPNGARLTTAKGEDTLTLAEVQVESRPGAVPNALDLSFGGKFVLAGYALDRRVAQPGDTISLTLYWRVEDTAKRDFRYFAHVLGANSQVWGQSDGLLERAGATSSQWAAGEMVSMVVPLKVGLTTPPGFYDIEVGLYDLRGRRLQLQSADSAWLDNRAVLSKIRVLESEGK